MEKELHILILEDLPSDAELAQKELKKVLKNYMVKVVDTEKRFVQVLATFNPDVIISDYLLPAFDGLSALQITREKSPFTPFIILTGSMNEDTAIECIKAGADDYVIKEHIKHLGPAVLNALENKKIELERKKAEEALQRYKHIVSSSTDMLALLDKQFTYLAANKAYVEAFKLTPKQLIGNTVVKVFGEEFFNTVIKPNASRCLGGEKVNHQNWIDFPAYGRRYMDVNYYPYYSKDKKIIGFVVNGRDITERKRAEEEQRLHAAMMDNVAEGVYLIGLDDLRIKWTNERFTRMFGYDPGEMIGKRVDILNAPTERTPTETRIAIVDVLKETGEWHGEVRNIKRDGTHFWCYANVSLFDHPEYGKIMVSAHTDITERKQAEERLRKSMDATIDTMSKIIEARDPYTSGHQHRVCQLAVSLAQELGLSEDKVEGVRIASLIHDIGKISLPTEILSKPTKLTDIEFSLIKDHSRIGYDILKSIEFSYPIAKTVLQHHERLDGTGYPNKVKGDEIILEAKIIGIADVVEAMSSHRPYRPALGIDRALEEISQNRGTLYDPEVVNACLKLFKEKGFKLK